MKSKLFLKVQINHGWADDPTVPKMSGKAKQN